MDSFKLFGINLTETTAPVAACAWLEPFVESDLDAAFDWLLTGVAPVSDTSAPIATRYGCGVRAACGPTLTCQSRCVPQTPIALTEHDGGFWLSLVRPGSPAVLECSCLACACEQGVGRRGVAGSLR